MAGIDNDKAQVILVGGFLIAIGVLSAILMLNSISYSQTIASQNGNAGDFGPIEFSDSAEVAVSEAMTGNGTDPSNATVEFEEYIKSYSDRANEVLLEEGVSAEASVPNPPGDTTESWMVGQRGNGTFQNATGGEQWIMAEQISRNDRLTFNLSVKDMPLNQGFVLNATKSGDFSGGLLGLFDDGWTLEMNKTATGEITLESSDYTSLPVPESETVGDFAEVDLLNETVDGSPNAALSNIDASGADGFRFEEASNGIGTYDFRFDDSTADFTNSLGPCNNGQPCRTVDSTEKHIVGVVHNITSNAVELDYVGRSTSYSRTIGGMVLDADDVNLGEIRNVDNASYFDVNITGDNAPVEEGGGTDIQVNYEVENTGTQTDTQNVTLEIPKGNVRDGNDVTRSPTDPPATGTLSWTTSSGDNGSYTAYVISNKSGSVDTTQVSVDKDTPSGAPGIPDGPVGFALPSPVFETLAGVTQR